jgi:hypothetical protein
MRHLLLRWLLPALLACASAASANAESVSAGDAQQMRAVIQAQLDAFAAGDADAAFAQATPELRRLFGSPEAFMAMVSSGYAVVLRPAAVRFLAPRQVGGETLQPVDMTDAAGAAWAVLYQLKRQPDGAWRISGCEVLRLPGRSI